MQTFTHQGKHFILINGKEYYLIKGYRKDTHYGEWIFLQVYGKVPLHPEDLLSDDWQLIKTKTKGEHNIYTTYLPKYFDYRSLKDDQYKKLFFIGMTEQGSLFLALNFLRDQYKLKIKDIQFEKIVKTVLEGKVYRNHINQIEDQGNSEQKAYYIEFDQWKMNEERAGKLFGL